MTDERSETYNRLRRLQELNLTNLPALIAQRAVGSFTLQAELEQGDGRGEVRVIVYPQDPFVGEPEVRTMQARDIRPGLINARVRIRDSRGEAAQPDDEGSYLYWPGSVEFDQVNCFYYTTFTLRMYERYARRDLPWSFPLPRIDVDPHAGNGVNAFYNEQDRLLGFYKFERNGETFNAAESADVISHETAHAVLDGLRDLHNESFGLGATAFHESFGDMTSVLVALHDDSLVTRLLEWTGGDLRRDNFIVRVAENLARASGEPQEHVEERTVYLRNALNNFKAAPFDTLPYRPDEPLTQLGRENHNYSRVFTGAFYDLFVGVYEDLRAQMQPRIALHRARDVVGGLLTCAIEMGPVGELDFADMARAFLSADSVLHDGRYMALLTTVFDARRILPAAEAKAHLATLTTLPDLRLPPTLNSALASALFLEEHIVPALALPADAQLTPMAAYRNGAGNAFLTYFSYRRLMLRGERYGRFDGTAIDAFGGLTLMFDRENYLRSAVYRPVTDEDARQIGVMVADLITMGLIADPIGTPGARPLHLMPDRPKGLWVPGIEPAPDLSPEAALPSEPAKLVKFPVIFDGLPRPLADFLSYLRAMQKR